MFEGLLSEAVKADIHHAVSSTAGGNCPGNPLAITAGRTKLCRVPKARCKNGGYGGVFGLESWTEVGRICSLFSVLFL